MMIYLFPEALRRGQLAQVFIVEELGGYWLGVLHGLQHDQNGVQYLMDTRQRISKQCYEALLEESRNHHRMYVAK